MMRLVLTLVTVLLACFVQSGTAAVLPEDRGDALYHYYDGGGVEVEGPSILVRKKVVQDISVYANYYVDSVSSASIDVLATASPYDEDRTEVTVGGDYLSGDTLMNISYTNSDEDDYEADTINFGLSQEIFGGLTTVSMGYGSGSDTVGNNTDPDFSEPIDRKNYRLGLSQVITRHMLVGLAYEAISDEGYLNNPYRSVRYLDSNNPDGKGYSYQPEVYPNTRTSNAVAVQSRYYLDPRSAVYGGYRFFTDDWGIDAHTLDVGYTRPLAGGWILDAGYRFYTQDSADFYSDLFPYKDAQNYLARDKELSSFNSHTLRFGVSYDILGDGWRFVDKGSVNLYYDHIMFDYDDFRNVLDGGEPGTEPLYDFDADVIQLFVSIWF
jgi:hypothetical protein